MANPNIAEAGKATRFGAGNDPRKAQQNSVISRHAAIPMRDALRHIGCLKHDNIHETAKIKIPLPENPTMVYMIAAAIWEKALAGDDRALFFILRRTQDKLRKPKSLTDDQYNEMIDGLNDCGMNY